MGTYRFARWAALMVFAAILCSYETVPDVAHAAPLACNPAVDEGSIDNIIKYRFSKALAGLQDPYITQDITKSLDNDRGALSQIADLRASACEMVADGEQAKSISNFMSQVETTLSNSLGGVMACDLSSDNDYITDMAEATAYGELEITLGRLKNAAVFELYNKYINSAVSYISNIYPINEAEAGVASDILREVKQNWAVGDPDVQINTDDIVTQDVTLFFKPLLEQVGQEADAQMSAAVGIAQNDKDAGCASLDSVALVISLLKGMDPTRSAPVAAAPATPAPAVPASPPADLAVELAFWNTIAQSSDPADFQAYLQKFPGGQFAALARNRLKTLAPQ